MMTNVDNKNIHTAITCAFSSNLRCISKMRNESHNKEMLIDIIHICTVRFFSKVFLNKIFLVYRIKHYRYAIDLPNALQ